VRFFVTFSLFSILSSLSTAQNSSEFKAAAGSVVITPKENVLMGGFDPNRMSTGVHDDLYARCVVLEAKNLAGPLVFVSLDLLGLSRYDVMIIKKELWEKHRVNPAYVFISSTHQHAGPDTMGLWGRIPIFTKGRNENYMKFVRDSAVTLIAETVKKTKPATLKIAKTKSDGFSKNRREPELLDPDIFIILVDGKEKRIATMVNFGCHPEVIFRRNTLISADFPGVLVKILEEKYGGTALFINGILGGMITPDTGLIRQPKYRPIKKPADDFEKCEAMAKILAQWIVDSISSAETLQPVWRIRTAAQINVPMENHAFKLGVKYGAILTSPEVFKDWEVITEITVIHIGDAIILAVPGEILPKLGLEIKSMFPGKYVMMFTLTNDELGYILHPDDWPRDLYSYERSMSVGKRVGELMLEKFKAIAANK
jgi:hypothetical protein